MFGMQIFRSDGALQFDASLSAFNLRSKGVITTQSRIGGNTSSSTGLVPIASQFDPVVIAARSTGFTVSRTGIYQDQSTGNWYALFTASGPVGSTFNYWLFDQFVSHAPTPSGTGLQLFNQAGQLTYDSNMDVMRIGAIINNVGNQLSLDSSRSWAAAQQTWAGHRHATDIVYRNGTRYTGTTSDGGNYTWSRQNDGKVYGTRWDGSTVFTEAISWDDVVYSAGFGRTPTDPPPDYTNNLGAVLLIDVTGQ